MLRQARGKGLAAVCAPAESLPFLKGSFERIIMVDALHHVADQAGTASELWRVLAPGGLLVILEPDIRQLAVKGIALFEKIALMRSHFLPPSEIARLFELFGAQPRIEAESASAWILIEKER
jgi:demethylmenaquinone methyltransferase/2-methoxy-6-polyprenyl-1,4-benzoquinol methylase